MLRQERAFSPLPLVYLFSHSVHLDSWIFILFCGLKLNTCYLACCSNCSSCGQWALLQIGSCVSLTCLHPVSEHFLTFDTTRCLRQEEHLIFFQSQPQNNPSLKSLQNVTYSFTFVHRHTYLLSAKYLLGIHWCQAWCLVPAIHNGSHEVKCLDQGHPGCQDWDWVC